MWGIPIEINMYNLDLNKNIIDNFNNSVDDPEVDRMTMDDLILYLTNFNFNDVRHMYLYILCLRDQYDAIMCFKTCDIFPYFVTVAKRYDLLILLINANLKSEIYLADDIIKLMLSDLPFTLKYNGLIYNMLPYYQDLNIIYYIVKCQSQELYSYAFNVLKMVLTIESVYEAVILDNELILYDAVKSNVFNNERLAHFIVNNNSIKCLRLLLKLHLHANLINDPEFGQNIMNMINSDHVSYEYYEHILISNILNIRI
jgi:hypothetical protein